jgi:hypothetical protein
MTAIGNSGSSELDARMERNLKRIADPHHAGRADALADREHLVRDMHEEGRSIPTIAKMADLTTTRCVGSSTSAEPQFRGFGLSLLGSFPSARTSR